MSSKGLTPHNRAAAGDFADTVLMPGDPLRAKYIAETFLENARLVTDVRNMFGYTGTYHGREISVMGSGMGMPSIGIYSHELYVNYGVEKIIRIGSAGSVNPKVQLMDIVIAQGASTNSSWAEQFRLGGSYAPLADWDLLYKAVKTAEAQGVRYVVGNVLSEDQFYHADPEFFSRWADMGILCLEMESAALYMEAARCRKKALAMFTISDEVLTGRELDAKEREIGFTAMMKLALEL